MAKKTATTKKPAAGATRKKGTTPAAAPIKSEQVNRSIVTPQEVHRLFEVPGPCDPPPPPIPTAGGVPFWDCGRSINDLRRRRPDLFSSCDWLDGQRFTKDSDSWQWRLLRIEPVGRGEAFEHQRQKLPPGGEPPLARALVAYLVLHFLATGERLDIPRLRCQDVLTSGRRVIVGSFRETGLEVANVSDHWASPGIATCAIFTPVVARKR